jgi:hypothetical protein
MRNAPPLVRSTTVVPLRHQYKQAFRGDNLLVQYITGTTTRDN